jgi:hypothetical protein
VKIPTLSTVEETICMKGKQLKEQRRRLEGELMGANHNSSQELGIYSRINPIPLSSNSVKTG